MRYTAWEEFWWNSITGARTVVDRVAMALLENKMVVLKVPSDLPWRYPMRSAIQNAFNERTDARDIVIETIDAVDNNPTDQEPGRFILQTYASSSIRTGYREKSRISIQDYISDRNVIKNRIIWVKGLDQRTAGKWLSFCRGFSPRSAADGLFVLEVHGNFTSGDSRYIQSIDFDDCVSSYDVQQFNSFIMDESSYSTDWKRYIAAAAASVCGTDAELSAMLLEQVDFRSETAVDGLQRIDRQGDFDRRGAEDGSDHPLRYLRTGGTAELWHPDLDRPDPGPVPSDRAGAPEADRKMARLHRRSAAGEPCGAVRRGSDRPGGGGAGDPVLYDALQGVRGLSHAVYPGGGGPGADPIPPRVPEQAGPYELLRPRPGGRPAGRRLLKIKAPVGRTVSHRPANGGLRRPPGKLLRDLLIIFCLLLVDK